MRVLILAAILGMAIPASADPMSEAPSKTNNEIAPIYEPDRAEDAQAGTAPVIEPEPALPPVSASAVQRGTFATEIDHREPIDSITTLENDRDRVYYFTEFVGLEGRELTHRWEYKGEIRAEVPIEIGGSHWRAYSSKNLFAGELGEWTVSVVDESGNVVRKDSLTYEMAAPEPAVAASRTTPGNTPAAATAPAAATPESRPDEMPASPASMRP